MNRKTWYTVGGGVVSVALLASAFAIAHAEPQGPPADRGKKVIETGAKAVVGQPVPPAALDPKDFAKMKVERPTEAVLARARAEAAKAEADKGFVNPKVPTGKVTWHDDLAAACTASVKSGKPVLLFQMMGKLDDKFC